MSNQRGGVEWTVKHAGRGRRALGQRPPRSLFVPVCCAAKTRGPKTPVFFASWETESERERERDFSCRVALL